MNRNARGVSIAVQAFVFLLVGGSIAPSAPVVSEWLNASSGNWTNASNWSTAPNHPNNGSPIPGAEYDARIDAAGSPYSVSLVNPIALSTLTIDSPAATLSLSAGRLSAGKIDIAQGKLIVGGDDDYSNSDVVEIVGAEIVGAGGSLEMSPAWGATPVLDGVKLGIDIVVPSSGLSPPSAKLVTRGGLELMNGATISIVGRDALMHVDGSQAIDGSGQIVFEDTSPSFRTGAIRFAQNTALTIGSGIAIRALTMHAAIGSTYGSGIAAPNIALRNDGLISGEGNLGQELAVLNVDPTNGAVFENYGVVQAIGNGAVIVGGDWSNAGTFRVRDNGKLILGGRFSADDFGAIDRQGGEIYLAGQIDNVGKTIAASSVMGDLVFGRAGNFVSGPTRLLGGVLDSTDGAKWKLSNGELVDVTIASDATMEDNSRLQVSGDLTLDHATISLFSNEDLSTNSAIEFLDGMSPQAIRGIGTIRFAQGRVNTIRLGSVLTIGDNIVVESTQGHAELRNGRLINEGTIRSGAGSTLDLPVQEFVNRGDLEIAGFTTIGRGVDSQWKNEGTIRVTSGGSLALSGTFSVDDMGNIVDEGAARIWLTGVLDNTGRTLDLETLNLTVPLTFNGGEIRGGRVVSSGDATLGFVNPGTFNSVTLATDLTIGGSFSQLNVRNGLTLDQATLTMPEGTSLIFSGSGHELLGGTGTIYAPNRPDASAITRIAGSTLTIGENITIRNGSEAFRELEIDFEENRGTIIAEAPNSLVSIGRNISPAAGPTWKNSGVIRVLNGTLQFWGNYSIDDIGNLEHVGGQIVLQGNILNEGKTIVQNTSTGVWKLRGTVRGGRIETGDGVRADVAGTFDNVTLAGEAVLFDEFSTTANGALRIPNTLTFDSGTLTIERFAELSINQHVLLTGTGQILLNGTPQDSLIQTFTGGKVTIGPHIAVRTGPNGGGAISRSNLPVINQGTISAETLGQVLLVDGDLQNTGLLQARDGATLRIDADNWVNQGTIQVEDGVVICRSISVTNAVGALITGNGMVEFQQTQFTNQGTISPGSSVGRLDFRGGVRLGAGSLLDIELAGTTAQEFDLIEVIGDAVLDGQLQVSLINGFELRFNQSFQILNLAGNVTGEFDGFGEGGLVGNYGGKELFISYLGGDGNDVTLYTAVPEPSSASMLLLSCLVALQYRGRCRTRTAK